MILGYQSKSVTATLDLLVLAPSRSREHSPKAFKYHSGAVLRHRHRTTRAHNLHQKPFPR